MGIDYSGGMIVGEEFGKINIPEDYEGEGYEWVEDVGLERFSPWYDAEVEYCVVGFSVSDVSVDEITGEWLSIVQRKARKFYELTGVKAKLIGMQDIT